MNAKLTFKRRILKYEERVCSSDRPFIEFIINDVFMSDLLDVGKNICKFGWRNNKKWELGLLKEFNEKDCTRSLENGFVSLYVCNECGDEGCLAAMFNIEWKSNTVIWKDFFWSDGEFLLVEEPDNIIDIKPIIFDKEDYLKAFAQLEKMILND